MNESTRQDLESKVTFLENTVDALNEVILAQGKDLEAVGERLRRLELRSSASAESPKGLIDPLSERPPHY